MEFYSNTRKPLSKSEDFTKTTQAVYRKEIDKRTGETRLVKDREVDIYAKIQEYADEAKLSNILQRYNVNMLSKVKDSETQLVDLTNLPENLLEALTTIDNAKYLWERQPKELKQKFDNDFKKFIAGSENGQIMEILTKELNTAHERFDISAQANYVSTDKAVVQPTNPGTTIQPVTPVTQPAQNTNNGGIVTNV